MRLNENNFESCLEPIRARDSSSVFVDFSFDNLNNEQLQQLLSALATNTVCYSLNLGVNNLDVEACELIANYLARNPEIKILELSGNNLSSGSAILILQALCFNSKLQFLAFKDNDIDDDAIPYIQQLQQINDTLKEIDLRFNKFSLSGMLRLSDTKDSPNKAYTNSYGLCEEASHLIMHRRVHKFFHIKNEISSLVKRSHPEQTYNLIDLIKYSIMNSIDQKVDIEDFFNECLAFKDTRKKIVSFIVTSETGEERDELLRMLGHCLFLSSIDSGIEAVLFKIYAHICFAAITNPTEYDKRLLTENYRSLVGDLGLIESNDFREWKNIYTKKMPYPITKIADKLIAEIFKLVTCSDETTNNNFKNVKKSLCILHTFKNKTLMHRELSNKYSNKHSKPALSF